MKIYMIRHGETDWNVQKRFQGREDIPLNENGIVQAQGCGQALQGEEFAAVFTSPLKRAKKTAEIIAEYVGVPEVTVEDGLIEREFGTLSGMTPEERNAYLEAGKVDDREPWEEVCERMIATIRSCAEQYVNDSIILVSHGAAIWAAIEAITGFHKDKMPILKNACINILDYSEGKLTLGAYNMTADEYKEK